MRFISEYTTLVEITFFKYNHELWIVGLKLLDEVPRVFACFTCFKCLTFFLASNFCLSKCILHDYSNKRSLVNFVKNARVQWIPNILWLKHLPPSEFISNFVKVLKFQMPFIIIYHFGYTWNTMTKSYKSFFTF